MYRKSLSLKYDMPVSLKILMGRGYDANPSVALIINNKTFLFNAPSQVYRAMIENHVRPRTLKYVILTSNQICASSGLSPFVGYYSMSTPVTFNIIGPSNFFSYFYNTPDIIQNQFPFSSIESSLNLPYITVSPIQMSKSLSYIVEIRDPPLNINQQKLQSLKIPPGPWITDLKKNGFAEVNGITIRKEDIFAKDNIYKLLFVDIQDLSDLTKPPLEELNTFNCIIHFTHPNILLNEKYINFFSTNKSHTNFCFLDDPSILFSNSKSFYDNYSLANPTVFPPIPEGYIDSFPNLPSNFTSLKSKDEIENFTTVIHSDTLTTSETISNLDLLPFSTFSLTFLGTSSCVPTPYGCNSGYMVQTHEGFIVLDCGNGFVEQIQRRFGPNTSEFIFKNLKCIWISHRHFDHFLGLVDLLFKHAQVLKKYEINDQWVSVYCDSFISDIISEKLHLYEKDENIKFYYNTFERDTKAPIEICGVKIESIPTTHCESSMSCVITFSNGKRLAYTGDMFHDKKFENAVKHCDYLISETTYSQPTFKTEKYNHMDYNSVMQIKKNLGVEYLFMTHFGGSYNYDENTLDPNSIHAFDYLYLTDDTIQDVFSIGSSITI